MKEKKKKLFSILSIVLLIILVLGATYAYFASQTGGSTSVDVTLTADTVDTLVFTTGDAITLNATQENFATGDGSLSSSTTATATLTANSTTNSASGLYYVYLSISTNEYVYTTDDNIAELILTVTDPDGNEITTLNNLDYVSVTDNTGAIISGFDITKSTALIKIAEDYEITSTDTTVHEWTITVTFVNLSTDQSDNAGSSFSAKLIIQEDERITLADYIISLYTTDGSNSLYYFDGKGDYTNASLETADYSYRFSGGDYAISDEYSDTYSNVRNSLITYSCNGVNYSNFAECSVDYEMIFTLIPTGETFSTYKEALNAAIDYGYINDGLISNYVCFGGIDCNDINNLYRIVGVFLNNNEYQVKLVKADYATSEMLGEDGDYGGNSYTSYLGDSYKYFNVSYRGNLTEYYLYYWNDYNYTYSVNKTGYSNSWTYSALNTINLNTNLINYLGQDYSQMIAMHEWIIQRVDNITYLRLTPSVVYINEMSNSDIYNSKIALLYVSDYGYSAYPEAWSTNLYDFGSKTGVIIGENNWLYLGNSEYLITAFGTGNVSRIIFTGAVNGIGVRSSSNDASADDPQNVRPTFYLNSSVEYSSGTGTQSDPIILVTE